jgi:hypothetical protein
MRRANEDAIIRLVGANSPLSDFGFENQSLRGAILANLLPTEATRLVVDERGRMVRGQHSFGNRPLCKRAGLRRGRTGLS